MKCDCGNIMDLEYSSESCEIRWCCQCGRLVTVHKQENFHVLWTPVSLKLAEKIQQGILANQKPLKCPQSGVQVDKALFKKIASEVAIDQMVPKADRGIAVGFALKCVERWETHRTTQR